jgi:hypothetical protein
MPRVGKFIDTESRTVVARGWEELMFNRNTVLVWENEKGSGLDGWVMVI